MSKKKGGKRKQAGKAAQREKPPAQELAIATSPSVSRPPIKPGFPIVGIGASAGGLASLIKLFSHLPSKNGMAFVLVPHLDPKHQSLMPELLGKHTDMPVREVTGPTPLQVNHVYIIPPNRYLILADGILQLSTPPDHRASYGEIDNFLCSLAKDQQQRAIGIVLSGTGQHGVRGLQEIKAAGGMVMAEAPQSATYPSMPQAAIDAATVDYILAPEEMPAVLAKYAAHPYVSHVAGASAAAEPETDHIHRVLDLLRAHAKYDFRAYRKKMVMRRVERRMSLNQIDKLPRYIEMLRERPEEVKRLFQDLLIGVTEFFRAAAAFEILGQQVLPEMIARIDADRPLRVWVPGCASGEEAYSIAILLHEQFATVGRDVNLQIFATDIDEPSLERARRGVYTESALNNFSSARRRQFLVKVADQRYHVSKQLRESVVFASQNLISDPPFSKLDLISCRNLLIYLEPEVQSKIIAMFHFSLNPGGCLLLGPSESIGRATDRFEAVSAKWRLFRRVETNTRGLIEFPIVVSPAKVGSLVPDPDLPLRATEELKSLTERLLLRNTPAAVLINRRGTILNYHGPTQRYLGNPAGPPTDDVLSLALEGLRTKLRVAIYRALRQEQIVLVEDARVKRDGTYHPVRITVEPLRTSKSTDGLLLVTFEDRDPSSPRQRRDRQASPAIPDGAAAQEPNDNFALVSHLESELKATREDLQGTIEEQESANEELQAANEEVMSMNEELQSANEELESAKEEMQSLNEELSTVNTQLAHKLQELESANNDITNLLHSIDIAIVFLDGQFRVKLFTPTVERLFSLRETDIGRPIADLSQKSSDVQLLDDCRVALDKLIPVVREVWTSGIDTPFDGEQTNSDEVLGMPHPDVRCYVRRVLPYRTTDDRIDGVAITFVDITDRKRTEQVTHAARLYSEGIVETVRHPLVVLDAELRVQSANAAFYALFRLAPQATEGRLLYDIGSGQWDIPELRILLEEVLPHDTRVTDYLVRFNSGANGQRTMLLNASQIHRVGERSDKILLAIEDITDRRRAEEALRALNQELEQRVAERTQEIRLLSEAITHLGEGVLITADDLDWPGPQIVFVNQAMCETSGYAADELIGQSPRMLQSEENRPESVEYIRSELAAGRPCVAEVTNFRKDGTPYEAEVFITPLFDAAGHRTNFVSIHRDITARKRIEQDLREREERLRSILNTAADAIITIDQRGIMQSVNPAAVAMFGYTAEELLGQNVQMLMPSPYRDEHDGYIARFLQTGEARLVGIGRELVGLRRHGKKFPIALAVSLVDHLGLFTGIIRDITERVALQKQVLEIAAEEDRRIGHELHDNTQQQLTGLGLLATSLAENLGQESSPHAAMAMRLATGIKESTNHVHLLARGLVPVDVDAEGLRSALTHLAEQIVERYGVQCEFRCSGRVDISDNFLATHLYRIAQEAINNAVKHGKANRITICLDERSESISLEVLDNGIGIAANDTDASCGIGLRIIQYRASLIGATVQIGPAAAGGTLLNCVVSGGGGVCDD